MSDQKIQYSDFLVTNLIHITHLDTQIQEYLRIIDKQNPDFIEYTHSVKAEVLLYFARLLGVSVPLKDAKRFSIGMNKAPETDKERIMLNIRNMLDYIASAINSEKFSLALLVHLNKLFLDSIKDIWDTAKFVGHSSEIDNTYDMPLHKDIILHSDVQNVLRIIEMEYANSQMPFIVKDTILAYELLSKVMFVTGSDAVSLGAYGFVLWRDGMNPLWNPYKGIYSILISHNSKAQAFSMEAWLELVTSEMVKELSNTRQSLLPFVEEYVSEQAKFVDINIRQIKGIHYIKEKGKISREVYGKLNSVSQITAYRDLHNLLQKGYVRVEGIGKGTKYVI